MDLKAKLAVVALRHYKSAFAIGGKRTDLSKNGWKPRKDKLSHPILNKSGRMYNSITTMQTLFGFQVRTNGIVYAGFHNRGTDRLPQREFLGKSQDLKSKFSSVIISEASKSLRNALK